MTRIYTVSANKTAQGTFEGWARTVEGDTYPAIDFAGGFRNRYQALKWAKKCRSAQMANDCTISK
jgi:hypothetical protein